jgi:hypothetical protein
MSKVVWKKLNSPKIVPSAITLRAYDGRPSSPKGIFQNAPIELGGKTILIDIEVIDAPLDYNILFGCSYMYAMKVITSSLFRMMMFPHNEKIITIDQLTHYEPNHSANIDNILPLVCTILDAFMVIDMGPGIFKDPSLLGEYHGASPLLHPSISSQVCVVSSNVTYIKDTTPLTEAPPHITVPPVEDLLPLEFPEHLTTPLIQDPPPPPRGNPGLGYSPPSHYPNSIFLPPTWSPSIPGSCYSHPSKHGSCHPCLVYPSTRYGSYTISSSSDIGITDADPRTGSCHTTPPPTSRNTTTTRGRLSKNKPIAPLPPRAQPPCTLCDREGHPTKKFPTLPELHNLIQLPKENRVLSTALSTSTATTESSTTRKKGTQTNFSCAIFSEYGHYTLHCPTLPQFHQKLATIRHTSRLEPSLSPPTEAHITEIHYVSSSVPK